MFKGFVLFRWIGLLAFLFLCGCAAAPVTLLPAALPAIITGAGGGISYTFTNVAYKVTTHPMEEVDQAMRLALDKMTVDIKKRKEKENQIKIKAKVRKLTIYITLDKMTDSLTRITVNAKRLFFLKDKNVAFEIIAQTEGFLYEPEELRAKRLMEGNGP
ncbi:MAG: DUF3568 family protein [Deltaproteobacteria bacterium]|nr:DUF3568 family protein [Deltaproteobacteria bacterium]